MQCDYVVVGTGSAGSVVANRLSTEAGNNVAVLEAGRTKISSSPTQTNGV